MSIFKNAFIYVFETITLRKYFGSRINVPVVRKVSEQGYKYANYLITLSSSIIGITFALLQFSKSQSSSSIASIKISWILFGLVILVGVIFHILDLFRIFMEARAEHIVGDGKHLETPEFETEVRKLNDWGVSMTSARYSYVILILQSILFFVATVFVIIYLVEFS